MRERPGPHRPCTDPAARYESCSRPVELVQAKLPHPIKAAQVPHIQHERAVGFDDGHRPVWASSERNVVANREVLELGENSRGARAIEVAEETIELHPPKS